MPRLSSLVAAISMCFVVSGCSLPGPSFQPTPTGPFEPPEAPPRHLGQLSIRIVYPPIDGPGAVTGESIVARTREGYSVQSTDSAFVFGSVGRADANLLVNGEPVPVFATGGWIAWLPLPDDSVARFDVVATAGGETARLVLVAPIAGRGSVNSDAVWIDATSFSPSGDRWIRAGEGIQLSLRATPGAQVHALSSDGEVVRFLPDTSPATRSWGESAFSAQDPESRNLPATTDRYVAWWAGKLGPDPDIVMAPNRFPEPADSHLLQVEAVVGSDTARAHWPLQLGLVDMQNPLVVVVDDDLDGTGTTDGILAGRPSPWGTYHWFFPNGTMARVSGRWNNQVRLQLSATSSAWVDDSGVYPLPPGTPPPGGLVRSLRLTSGQRSVVVRIPLTARIPFRVDEDDAGLDVRLYGVAADIDWIQYGGYDPLIKLVSFSQPTEDETVVSVELSTRVWGYRTHWSGNDLMIEIRRPPELDPRRPLEGRRIAIDAGHPPGGATGPTGTPESVVTLDVARKVKELLEQFGAQPILVRESEAAMGLYERIEMADATEAEILVSIHANALPDGVNPFTNNGTSVYYFHPRSVGLARELNRALVRQLGFRDLGFGRGDLALARPTWMPSALTEGLFLMLPDQESVLVSDEGQWRYARGVVEGIAAFLREWALQAN
jgi:N-acetylmuramoyl-L-alanine amidase